MAGRMTSMSNSSSKERRKSFDSGKYKRFVEMLAEGKIEKVDKKVIEAIIRDLERRKVTSLAILI